MNKWEVTRDALIEAVAMLSDDTQLALLAYPNKQIDGTSGDASMCVAVDQMVELQEPGVNGHRQTIIDALNAVETNRCTPTHDAYATAVSAMASAQATGQKYILLMTHGQPTLRQGSATGLDNRWWLSESAEVGHTAKDDCSHSAEPYYHFDMTTGENFAADLRDALVSIVGQAVSCDYALPSAPPGETLDLTAINLILRPTDSDPLLISRMDDPSCTQGWYLDPVTQDVRLCPQTCQAVQSDVGASAELLFGCASIVEIQ